MASVGSILSGGFRLYREQPVTVVIWAGLHIAYAVGLVAIALAGFVTDFEAARIGAVSPMQAFGMAILFGLISLLAMSVMNCAIYRAILRPDEGGFASLRLGLDELRMFGLYLLLIAIGIIVALVAGLLMVAVTFGLGVARGGAGGFGLWMLFIAVIALIAIYIAVRLSLVFPTTFVRRRIAVDEGWRLSSGRFWTLFLALLVIWVIVMVLQMVLPQVPGQPGLLDAIRSMQDPGSAQALQEQRVAAAGALSFASMLPYVLIATLVQVFSNVTYGAAAATAVREFLRDDGEVLDDDVEATAQIFE